MRDAHFAGAEAVCQIGGGVELICRGITGRKTEALEGQRDRAQRRVFVRAHVLAEPALVFGAFLVSELYRLRLGGLGRLLCQRGSHERGGHAVQFGLGYGVCRAIVRQNLLVLGVHFVDEVLAFGFHQNLDACLVQVVAPAKTVVDAHHGFEVVQDLVPGQELAQGAGDHRGAAHAATDQHLEADLAGGVAHQVQAHVMPGNGGAVFSGTVDGDLEFARQEGKFRVQRAPLAHDFGIGPGVDDLVGGDAGQRVAGDVADAIAAGLDAVHVDRGQQVHDIGALVERNPVELHVLTGGEVAITHRQVRRAQFGLGFAGVLVDGCAGLVVLAGNLRQYPQLPAGQFAVRHGHTQHGRVALDVPAVLQSQRTKFVVAEFTLQVAFQLVAMLGRTLTNELTVKICVLVHVSGILKRGR